MSDAHVLTLERVLDDWISDMDMQGDYQSEDGLPRPQAYAAMVRQATDWIRRGVLVPGDLIERGFTPWHGSAEANARRFAEHAEHRNEVVVPGDLCWFDAGPATEREQATLEGRPKE